MNTLITYQMIFTTLPLAFSIIHLILFFFFRKSKENLYFALFLFFYSASIFFDYQNSMYAEIDQTYLYLRIHRAIQPFYLLFSLRFVYSLFYKKVLKKFWFFVPWILVFGIIAVIYPSDETGYKYFNLAAIPLSLEIIRVIIYSVIKKKYDAVLIGIGYFIYYFFSTFDSLMDQGINVPFTKMENPYAIGTIGFLITMSIHLAKRYSDTFNKIIDHERIAKEKEIEHRLLEAENSRKTFELEEARELQLSMLPNCLNDIPGFDICFYMEPATEVGGDYYDYLTPDDGTLVITIGDATGHGMKSGIMVSTIKSIFQSSGTDPDIPAFFTRSTDILKKMNMKNLFMALSIVRIKNFKLTASSAGMPYILILRGTSRKVEELAIKGPPLGSFKDFNYKIINTSLNSGDTILLMSDGFPEQFNTDGEMMGFEKAKEIFKKIPDGTSDEIVEYLVNTAKNWRKAVPQDDDMTFVVIKIK